MSIDLESLAHLDASATPGPWIADVLGSEGYVVREETGTPRPGSKIPRPIRVARCGHENWDTDRANAEFIAEMRNALPQLIERVREAEAADQHGYGDESDCVCGRNFKTVRGLREHLTKSRRVTDTDLLLKLSNQAVQMWKARAEAAEARLAHLEAGIKALADTMHGSAMDGRLAVTCSSVRDELRALLNGTDKDQQPARTDGYCCARCRSSERE